MNSKKMISVFLAILIVASISISAFALSPSVQEADSQLGIIFTTLSSLRQEANGDVWRYAVTDLNHNGCLEVIAASLHADYATNVKIWELSADGTSFQELKVVTPEGESFPDIIADSADTYHVAESDTWSYMFYDKIILSSTDVYTVKSTISLKDSALSFQQHAIEHAEQINGRMNTSYMDNDGNTISPETYNSIGFNVFASAEKSNTAFGWFRIEDITEVSQLADSYAVFTGEKQLEKSTPRPASTLPSAAPAQPATVIPQPSKAPQQAVPVNNANPRPAYLTITKNPTNENRRPGDKAIFVACANTFDSLTWTFVSPSGGEYSSETFQNYFGTTVYGHYSTTISVNNVTTDMNGWGAYCTFYYNGQTARTSTGYIYVAGSPVTPSPGIGNTVYGSISGTVVSCSNDVYYTIRLSNGYTVDVSSGVVNVVYGYPTDGCSCTVYYVAYPDGGYDIYSVDLYGSLYDPYGFPAVVLYDEYGFPINNYDDPYDYIDPFDYIYDYEIDPFDYIYDYAY